ncbi:MAG: CARDB domain-containing protein, partial [Planctomycetota bacterium]
MTVSQTALSLSYLGQVISLTASVLDQNGGVLNATKTWSSDDPSVATVTPGGAVTAVSNGVTTIRAASGNLSASASVTVQQVATLVAAVSGDGQTGTVGQALSQPLVVTSVDQGGFPVPGATVTFTVGSGGGSVTVAEATTDAQSLASTVWTLGTTSGVQNLTAAIPGAGSSTRLLSATAMAGPPAALEKVSGDGQTIPAGAAAFQPVIVKLTDAFGNGVIGGSVSFAVTAGNGSVTPSQASTVDDGTAQATWTMGAGLGANTLSATASGLTPVAFSATAVTAKADLEPSALATTPANPTALQSFEVSATITNVGFLTAGAGVQVQLLLDGAQAGTISLPSLSVGASSEATFPLGPLAAGTHTLQVVVDPGSTLDEWDESNNTAQHSTDIPVTTLITAGTPVPNLSAPDSVEHLFTLEVPASS